MWKVSCFFSDLWLNHFINILIDVLNKQNLHLQDCFHPNQGRRKFSSFWYRIQEADCLCYNYKGLWMQECTQIFYWFRYSLIYFACLLDRICYLGKCYFSRLLIKIDWWSFFLEFFIPMSLQCIIGGVGGI